MVSNTFFKFKDNDSVKSQTTFIRINKQNVTNNKDYQKIDYKYWGVENDNDNESILNKDLEIEIWSEKIFGKKGKFVLRRNELNEIIPTRSIDTPLEIQIQIDKYKNNLNSNSLVDCAVIYNESIYCTITLNSKLNSISRNDLEHSIYTKFKINNNNNNDVDVISNNYKLLLKINNNKNQNNNEYLVENENTGCIVMPFIDNLFLKEITCNISIVNIVKSIVVYNTTIEFKSSNQPSLKLYKISRNYIEEKDKEIFKISNNQNNFFEFEYTINQNFENDIPYREL